VTGSLVVRNAYPEDVPAIAGIFDPYALESAVTFETVPLTEREWLDRLQAAREVGHPFLVASFESTVIGYAYVTHWRTKPAYSRTVENSIYLDPAHSGRGYGRILLTELLDASAAAGMREVIAVIADGGSAASKALHRSVGFAEVGRLQRVGYKHGRWIDTVLMQRSLE
jgi:phosphinothricin acetyltransferase